MLEARFNADRSLLSSARKHPIELSIQLSAHLRYKDYNESHALYSRFEEEGIFDLLRKVRKVFAVKISGNLPDSVLERMQVAVAASQ